MDHVKININKMLRDRKANCKGNNDSAQLPENHAHLVSVSNRLVFVKNTRTHSFDAKIQVKNLSPRFVSFVVRSSSLQKFSVRPRYGAIPPNKTLDVIVVTKHVSDFKEISQDFFGVFAVPIYDQRQLERKKLNLLWRAHGTMLFPYESTEFHKIPYVIPKKDAYFDDVSILDRLCLMSHLCRPKNPTLINNDEPVDEETFLLNWPSEGHPAAWERSMEYAMADWHSIARKVHIQTRSIVESSKIMLAMMLTCVITFLSTTCLYFTDANPFDSLIGFRLNAAGDGGRQETSFFSFSRENGGQGRKIENAEDVSSSCVIS